MSMSLEEHDYIGFSDVPSMENSEKSCVSVGDNERKGKGLNLKATELRLGLPGSESPVRETAGHAGEDKNGYPLGIPKGLLVSGAKRGFSDTIKTNSGKWVFPGSGGSENHDLAKGGSLFSPRGVNGAPKILGVGGAESCTQQSFMVSNVGTETIPQSPKTTQEKKPPVSTTGHGVAPAAKTQVVGWPPVRSSRKISSLVGWPPVQSFRKNSLAVNPPKTAEDADPKLGSSCLYVKVSMDGAPYLRKVDLKNYTGYKDLSSALEKMFSCFTIGQCDPHGVHIRDGVTESRLMDLLHGSEYVLTYEDKDGDWMLVGDVPWE